MKSQTNMPTYEPCKCCLGLGYQTLLTGEKIRCKACNGTGDWNSDKIITF